MNTAKPILIGIGAGLAAALLFLAVASGTPIALPLFLLSPLPIAIAVLGFGTFAGIAAALTGALALLALTELLAATFLLVVALPVAVAAYLAGLARPAENGTQEWYPLSRVLAWSALLVGAGTAIVSHWAGIDEPRLQSLARDLFTLLYPDRGVTDPANAPVIEALVNLMRVLAPTVFSAVALIMLVGNLWIGGKVAAMSQLLARPWTPFSTARLPLSFLGVLFATILLSGLLPESWDFAVIAFIGAQAVAFSLAGLSALHALTEGRSFRRPLLAVTYVLLLFNGPILFLAMLLGFADSIFDFRARRSGKRPTT